VILRTLPSIRGWTVYAARRLAVLKKIRQLSCTLHLRVFPGASTNSRLFFTQPAYLFISRIQDCQHTCCSLSRFLRIISLGRLAIDTGQTQAYNGNMDAESDSCKNGFSLTFANCEVRSVSYHFTCHTYVTACTSCAAQHVRSNRKKYTKNYRSEVSRTFRSEVSVHFGPRSEVSIAHFGPRSEMLRHFGPNFLGPKCLRSEVSGHRQRLDQ